MAAETEIGRGTETGRGTHMHVEFHFRFAAVFIRDCWESGKVREREQVLNKLKTKLKQINPPMQ